MHKLYVQDEAPTEAQVLSDAEDDNLDDVEIISIKEYETQRVN